MRSPVLGAEAHGDLEHLCVHHVGNHSQEACRIERGRQKPVVAGWVGGMLGSFPSLQVLGENRDPQWGWWGAVRVICMEHGKPEGRDEECPWPGVSPHACMLLQALSLQGWLRRKILAGEMQVGRVTRTVAEVPQD